MFASSKLDVFVNSSLVEGKEDELTHPFCAVAKKPLGERANVERQWSVSESEGE